MIKGESFSNHDQYEIHDWQGIDRLIEDKLSDYEADIQALGLNYEETLGYLFTLLFEEGEDPEDLFARYGITDSEEAQDDR